MSQGFWKVYKEKVLQTFNTEQDGESYEESDTTEIIEAEIPDNGDKGLNMTQLAKKVQGALGWRSITSLFSKEEEKEEATEQKIEQRTEQTTEEYHCADLSDNPPETHPSALWNVFTSRWHQNSAERSQVKGVPPVPPAEQNEVHQADETPFKWGFLTSKLAELRNKND